MNISNMRIIFFAMLYHLKQLAIDGFVLFTVIVQPLLIAIIAIYMLKQNENFDGILIIIGSSLTGLWSGTLFFCSQIFSNERRNGTLEFLVISPTSLYPIILGKTLANVLMSTSSLFISYPLALLLFNFHIQIENPILFLISAILSLFSFLSLGLLISSFMAVNLRARVWENAMEFPMYVLGGFMFPISLLPIWTNPISWILSPYWIIQSLKITAAESFISTEKIFSLWGITVILNFLYCALSVLLLRKFLNKARTQATLSYQ